MGRFSLDMKVFAKKAGANADTVVRKTAIGLFSAVMRGTPVDTANAQFNWYVDFNSFSNKVDKNIALGSATPAIKQSEFELDLLRYKAGDTITLTNNSDHIEVLEYGLFPWDNSAKVINHFSTQAPKGMVRLNIMKFQTFVDNATRSLK